MNSGILPDNETVEAFNNLKLNRSNAYMICKVNEAMTEIVVDKIGEKGAPLSEIVDCLPKDDGRYIVYDFDYETDENPPRKTNKLVLFLWVPSSAPSKRRFCTASSNDAFKKQCVGIQKEFQVSDKSELDHDRVRKDLLKA